MSSDFLLIEHWDKNQNSISYICIQENWILTFSSAIWQPFCLDPNVPTSPLGPHNEIILFCIALLHTKLMMSQIHPGTFQKTRRSVQRRHTGAANCSRRHSSCGNQQRYLAWKEPHFDCRSLGGTNHKERPWAVTTTDCKYMGLGDVTKRSNITRYSTLQEPIYFQIKTHPGPLSAKLLGGKYRKISNISRTEYQNLNVSRLGLQLFLRNILKPSVMKM